MAGKNITYNVESNPINQGALYGRYAGIDLVNTGKFTNILSALPVRYRFKVSDYVEDDGSVTRTLTLVEGSTITILNGHSDTSSYNTAYEYLILNNDSTYNKITYKILEESLAFVVPTRLYQKSIKVTDPSQYKFVVYSYDTNELELVTGKQVKEGLATPLTYDEPENKMYSATGNQCSVPLGYFDGNWNFTAFNTLGFYDNMFWVDAGLEFLVPDGRTDIYGLNVEKVTTPKITFTIFDGTVEHENRINFESGKLLVRRDGKVVPTNNYETATMIPEDYTSGYIFLSEDNYIYGVTEVDGRVEKNALRYCLLCDIEMVNGVFSMALGNNVYQAANFKDLKDDIVAVDDSCVHLTGDEDITGDKHFSDKVTFDDAVMDGIDIVDGVVSGELRVEGVIGLNQTEEDIEAINQMAKDNIGYDGSVGGFHFKHDAYIVDAGTMAEASNCFNVVGATNASQGGIILGKYITDKDAYGNKVVTKITKIIGDGSDITLTCNNLMPNVTNKTNVGSNAKRYNVMYANTFNGTATKALWADLAEIYKTDENYPVGTLVAFGGDAEITIATDSVNAVISEKPAYLMNSDMEGQPIALAGRVNIRVVDKVKKFDKIYLSDRAGVGCTYHPIVAFLLGKKPIARALEEKETNGEGLVLCSTQFSI